MLHAYHYLNRLIDDEYVDPLDLYQIYEAILRIENEEIPNVPINAFKQEALPPFILRQRAVLLLMKGISKGLNAEEEHYLMQLLSLLLKNEELGTVWNIIQKIKNGDPKEIVYPVPSSTLEDNWRRNKKLVEAA